MSDAMHEQDRRRSRQEFVVPPSQSRFPVAVGALACGCLGFALVWVLGIGRRADRMPVEAASQADIGADAATHETAADIAPATTDQPLTDARAPQLFQGADATEMQPVRGDRWRPQGAADEPADESIQPASLDTTDLAVQAAAEPRRFSRFSSADLPPIDATPADASPEEPTDAPRETPERSLVAPVSSSEPETEPAAVPDTAADEAVDLQPLPETTATPSREPDTAVTAPETELPADPASPAADAPAAPVAEAEPPAVAPFAAAPAIAPPPAAAPAP
ncbi:MAG: hypothetical protein ACKOOF_12055, partial [Planctomycetaceae bacterium]